MISAVVFLYCALYHRKNGMIELTTEYTVHRPELNVQAAFILLGLHTASSS